MMGMKERNFSPLPWRASARSHATRAKRERRGAHPTRSSTLFARTFRHNTTLPEARTPSVTAPVTRERLRCELPRTRLPRTPLNRGANRGRD
jgi:hypothetical protein